MTRCPNGWRTKRKVVAERLVTSPTKTKTCSLSLAHMMGRNVLETSKPSTKTTSPKRGCSNGLHISSPETKTVWVVSSPLDVWKSHSVSTWRTTVPSLSPRRQTVCSRTSRYSHQQPTTTELLPLKPCYLGLLSKGHDVFYMLEYWQFVHYALCSLNQLRRLSPARFSYTQETFQRNLRPPTHPDLASGANPQKGTCQESIHRRPIQNMMEPKNRTPLLTMK